MNRWDSLLGWLAHQGETKWTKIKSASQKLSQLEGLEKEQSPLAHAMNWVGPLLQLGYAEFDSQCRTIVAISPGLLRTASHTRAILYGYWDPQLRKKLRRAEVRMVVHRPKRGPTCWAIQGDSKSIDEASENTGVWLAEDSSLALLKHLPSISSLLDELKRDLSGTDGVWDQLFGVDFSLRWRNSRSPLSAPGLYRRSSGRSIKVLVRNDLLAYRVDTMEQLLAAKWEQAPKHDWLYEPKHRRLLIPHGLPQLPTLVSRGLTMTSARLPCSVRCIGCRWWSYSAVSFEHAEQAARIMEQEISTRSVTRG